jgi:hypothetical protein
MLLPLLLLSLARITEAQVITGNLRGTVRDESGAVVPGALATIRSEALLGGPATFVTTERGQYRFPGLPPGLYGLTLELAGFRTYMEEGLRVEVGVTLERNVTLPIATHAESLTVTAESPLLDPKASGQSTNYGNELLENTPIRRLSMFDFIKSAPGMSATAPAGLVVEVSAFGSSTNENTFLVDGTDVTGAWEGRAVPGIDTDIIEEVQIVGLGASAEYGNLQGAVFNVVSKQGGNEFRFDASYYSQFQALTSQPIVLPCDCPEGESGFVRDLFRDFTAHVGGPVVKDRLWFFGGYQHQRDDFSLPGADPRYPNETDNDRIFWKINWQIAPNWKLMHSYHDNYTQYAGPYTHYLPYSSSATGDQHNPSLTFADITHIVSSDTFWDGRVSGYYWTGEWVPNSGYALPPHLDEATGIWSGGSQFFFSGTESRTVAHGKLSHYASDFLRADHEFKFGVQFVHAGSENLTGYPGGALYYDYYGEPYAVLFRQPNIYGSESDSIGAYAEDSLTVGEKLTVNLGIRFDRASVASQDLAEVDTFGEPTGETIEGLGPFYTWYAVSPRLGFTWKLDSGGRALLRGNWGRFHQGTFLSEAAFLHPGMASSTLAFYDPATGGYTDIAQVIAPTEPPRVDPGTRSPYTDQWSIGIETELFPDAALSATYVHKGGRDYIAWEDETGVYESVTGTLPDGRTVPILALVSPPEDQLFVLGNREQLFLRYDGLLLTLEKRWADRWQTLVSYSLSEAYGLLPSSGSDPGQFSSTFGGWFGRNPNDYTNRTGNLNNDRTHMFRVQGAVEIPGAALLVGANFQHLTGQPIAASARVRLPDAYYGGLIEPPGFQRLSAQTLLDLRISKIFRFGDEGKLELLADVLNLLNESAGFTIVTDNFYSPSYAKPALYVHPRRAMLGVKFSF